VANAEDSTAIATGFIDKTINIDEKEYAYSVYIPKGYDPSKKWPFAVFLHGIGERGDDGLLQTDVGIGRAIRRNPERFPFIVAMPQCPKDSMWDKRFDLIDSVVAQSLAELSIDEKRMYVTGLSMGGFGAWLYGAARVDKFAAILPICGGGKIDDAPALAKIPIWAFHGAEDSVVKPEKSREMVEAVKKAGGDVKYTEYPGVNHNSWDKAYGDEEAIAWLLKQSR